MKAKRFFHVNKGLIVIRRKGTFIFCIFIKNDKYFYSVSIIFFFNTQLGIITNIFSFLLTGISRILLPSLWGRGKGEGLLVVCYFLFFIHHFTAAFIISFMPSRISSILLCFNSPLPSPPACLRIKVLSWGE